MKTSIRKGGMSNITTIRRWSEERKWGKNMRVPVYSLLKGNNPYARYKTEKLRSIKIINIYKHQF